MTKTNLKSVLERQKNLNISFGNKAVQNYVIDCSNIDSGGSGLGIANSEEFQKQKIKIRQLRV